MVVDSSVLCALLFDEPERGQAQALLAGHQLFAPQLLDHEVLSVALKKLRRALSKKEDPGPRPVRGLVPKDKKEKPVIAG